MELAVLASPDSDDSGRYGPIVRVVLSAGFLHNLFCYFPAQRCRYLRGLERSIPGAIGLIGLMGPEVTLGPRRSNWLGLRPFPRTYRQPLFSSTAFQFLCFTRSPETLRHTRPS